MQNLLADQPEAPTYFAVMKRLNRDGMLILGKLPEPPRLTPERFKQTMDEGAVLVDTRDKLAFAGGHIRLVRVGLDDVVGYIPSLEGYAPSELETVPQITAEQAYKLWQAGETVILDVRGLSEYKEGHIPGALHIHAGRVLQRLHEVPNDHPVIVHCLGDDCSSTAISALMAKGYNNLYSLTGGILAWKEHNFPLETRN